MARTTDLDRVTAIILRLMRGPVLLLIIVYTIGIMGMVLIPGYDAHGNTIHMGFFHAFYFMTYTATTTGFGEIPREFSDPQRMWAIACLYLSVIAWGYAIGSIIRLVQNPDFRHAISERRFALSVKRMSEPFVIICGFGDTGSLLARGLSDRQRTAVVIDSDPARIMALGLRDYRVRMPGLCADASVPKHLIEAGLTQPNCRAVVILTNDEETNLKIAVMSHLLNPKIQVVSRSTPSTHEEQLALMGTARVLDPFESFASELCRALHAPAVHTLEGWMVGAHGMTLDRPLGCPMGTWIVCGFGRMGRSLNASLRARNVPTVIIDPEIEAAEGRGRVISKHASRTALKEAGIADAAGVVAATSSDSDNLGILLMARKLNPDVFLVVRQNHHENQIAFNAAHADLIMQPSLVTARRILLMLISPLVQDFLNYIETHDRTLLNSAYRRLRDKVGKSAPLLWTVTITSRRSDALDALRQQGHTVNIGDLLRSGADREQHLRCVVLVIRRGNEHAVLPPDSEPVEQGDELLLCGIPSSRTSLEATLLNPYTLHYLVTGGTQPRGYVMRWIQRVMIRRQVEAT